MAELKRIDRPSARRGQADPRHRRFNPEASREALATLGLYVLLTGAGFAAIYVGGNYVAYLLGID